MKKLRQRHPIFSAGRACHDVYHQNWREERCQYFDNLQAVKSKIARPDYQFNVVDQSTTVGAVVGN